MRRAPTDPIRPVTLALVEASPSGELAWREAVAHARRSVGTLVALRVLREVSRTAPADAPAHDPAVIRAVSARLEARQALERLIDAEPHIDAEVAIAEGSPALEVANTAVSRQATLVIVGDYGDRPAVRLPAVVDAVLQRTDAAVLVVRPGLRTGILLAAVDFSEGWDVIVATLAREAASRVAASPIVVHVLETSAMVPDASQTLLHALGRHDMVGEAVVLEGEPAHAIVRAAEEADAELVIVGAVGSGAGGVTRLGSVAERVLRHAPSSVLVVPMRRD